MSILKYMKNAEYEGRFFELFVLPVFYAYRVSQQLRSLLRDLIPELIPSEKCHLHMDPIRNDSGFVSF
jgi:hypothetical protein